MNATADALVIGGGPAGCAAAIGLARSGASVILLERDRVANAKVCGEFLSVEACDEARSLGVDLAALGAAPIDRVRVSWRGSTVESALPFLAASVSRAAFDEALLAAAGAAGAYVERGVRALAFDGGRVRVRGDEAVQERRARKLVLATGKTEFADLPRGGGRLAQTIGFKMHLVLPAADLDALGTAVELTLVAGGYAGMQRIENGLVAFALVVRRDAYARLGSWRALLAEITRTSPQLARRLEHAREMWPKPLAVSGVPYGFVHRDDTASEKPDVYRVGDQLAVIASFTGDGMAIALVTGSAAAQAIVRGDAPHTFHSRMRKRIAGPMFVAGALSNAIATPLGRAAVVWPARIVPNIFALVASQTRIARS